MNQVDSSAAAPRDRARLRDALELQEALLATLARRFEQTRATDPPPRLHDEWHGVAEQFYAMAADGLRRDLVLVAERLEAALADTRRALNTLALDPPVLNPLGLNPLAINPLAPGG